MAGGAGAEVWRGAGPLGLRGSGVVGQRLKGVRGCGLGQMYEGGTGCQELTVKGMNRRVPWRGSPWHEGERFWGKKTPQQPSHWGQKCSPESLSLPEPWAGAER